MRRREMLLPVKLPEAFQKVAYVQATKYPSYVDTKYIPDQDTRVCCKFERDRNASNIVSAASYNINNEVINLQYYYIK